MNKFWVVFLLLITSVSGVFAQNQVINQRDTQNDIYLNWHLKSPSNDFIFGAEVERAYNVIPKNKKATTIIVAVLDGGIDIYHDDLKENIWVNTNEIPDNGIDDDNNGYIDDINGWNFLGNSKGENIDYENLEVTRIYKLYKNKYDGINPKSISANETESYNLYIEAKEIYLKKLKEAEQTRDRLNSFESSYLTSKELVKDYLKKDTITITDLNTIKSEDKDLMRSAEFLRYLIEIDFSLDQIEEFKEYNNEELNYHLNLDFNPRAIINDNILELSPTYGNNNVVGSQSEHGTFVAGIIGAVRNNGLGINGIANNLKIMALNVVPNGDERDKDVANAIRYAADNGAKIINMSFGKELSPQKKLVDEAILYAQQKGVLFVHASGNDAANLDKEKNYPTKIINKNLSVDNWITVGASSMNNDLNFVADFSNYGKKSVDLFAPGVNIKSLVPDNKYDVFDGTSFSSPVVAGVAALIWSYYPELSASDIKYIILNSTNVYSDLKTNKPTITSKKSKKTNFKNLSITGGVVSAYKAFLLAESKYNKK